MISWRVAFFACGAPGILAALMVLRLNNPIMGINDLKETIPEGEVDYLKRNGKTEGKTDRQIDEPRDFYFLKLIFLFIIILFIPLIHNLYEIKWNPKSST